MQDSIYNIKGYPDLKPIPEQQLRYVSIKPVLHREEEKEEIKGINQQNLVQGICNNIERAVEKIQNSNDPKREIDNLISQLRQGSNSLSQNNDIPLLKGWQKITKGIQTGFSSLQSNLFDSGISVEDRNIEGKRKFELLKQILELEEEHYGEILEWCKKHAEKTDEQVFDAFLVHFKPTLGKKGQKGKKGKKQKIKHPVFPFVKREEEIIQKKIEESKESWPVLSSIIFGNVTSLLKQSTTHHATQKHLTEPSKLPVFQKHKSVFLLSQTTPSYFKSFIDLSLPEDKELSLLFNQS